MFFAKKSTCPSSSEITLKALMISLLYSMYLIISTQRVTCLKQTKNGKQHDIRRKLICIYICMYDF